MDTSIFVGDARYFFDVEDWAALVLRWMGHCWMKWEIQLKTENDEVAAYIQQLIIALTQLHLYTVKFRSLTQGEGNSTQLFNNSAPDVGYDEYGGVVEPEDPTTTSLRGVNNRMIEHTCLHEVDLIKMLDKIDVPSRWTGGR